MNWFKRKYRWFCKLKPLNKIFVIGSIFSIIGVVIFLVSFFSPKYCYEEDYDVCKEILKEIQRDKIDNIYTDPVLFNNLLKEKYGLTEKQIQNLAKNFKEYAKTEYDKGLALAGLNNYHESILHFSNAIDLDTSNPNYHYSKAVSQFFLNDFGSALTTINRALELLEHQGYVNEDFSIVKARILENLGRFDESVEIYDYWLSLNPNDSCLWHDRGVTLGEQGKYEESIESFDKALEIDEPDSIVTLDAKAISLMWLQRYNEVIIVYTEIIIRVPNYQKAYDNRGRAYFKIGDYQKALEDWKISLKMDGEEPFICRLSNVGFALLGLGKFEEANFYFQQAESLDKNFLIKCSRPA